jgi:hypothetical protein
LSFAHSDWVELGKVYPKAFHTLRRIRDEKTSRLLAGQADRHLFHDIESINELAQALAELGLIDEYEFVVHPMLAGHGPTLFTGPSKDVDLRLVSRREFGSGAVAMRYEPRAEKVAIGINL